MTELVFFMKLSRLFTRKKIEKRDLSQTFIGPSVIVPWDFLTDSRWQCIMRYCGPFGVIALLAILGIVKKYGSFDIANTLHVSIIKDAVNADSMFFFSDYRMSDSQFYQFIDHDNGSVLGFFDFVDSVINRADECGLLGNTSNMPF